MIKTLTLGLVAVLMLSLSAQAQFAPASLATGTPAGVISKGAMFEISATTNVVIDSFDCYFALIGLGLPTTIEVWALNNTGTYVGPDQTSNANWTQLATVPVLGLWTPPFPMNLNLGFPIAAGTTQSFYITHGTMSGLSAEYTAGPGQGMVAASDSNIALLQGHHADSYFNATSGSSVWTGVIHYTPQPTTTDDIELAAIVSPTNDQIGCNPLSATENVTIEVRNQGLNTITAGTILTVSYQIDAQPIVTEFFVTTASMTTGDTAQYTFTTTADFSTLGSYTLTSNVLHGPDLEPGNDSITTPIGSGGQLYVDTFPFTEDFDLSGGAATATPPLGFINETTDSTGTDSDWLFRADATPTSGVGPQADHTTGVPGMNGFAYVDGDGLLPNVSMRTPCFDLGGTINPSLRYWVHSFNTNVSGNDNTLAVDVVSHPGGTVTMNVAPPIGDTGTDWNMHAIDMSAFNGQVVQAVFRVATDLVGNSHDIGLDDVSLTNLVPTPGQAPQPGLGVFQVGDARNANGDPISFGFGGPYFSDVAAGSLLGFEFEGEPSQAIVFFGGGLNPQAATFPGVGSIDVGFAPLDPVTGIPSGIVLYADGNASGGFNPFFVTDINGRFEIGLTIPSIAPGILGSFQAAILTAGSPFLALTNAIEIQVL